MLLHDNPQNTTYVLGCYRLTDLELLSLIPQGHKKNRYHSNFFFCMEAFLCVYTNSVSTQHMFILIQLATLTVKHKTQIGLTLVCCIFTSLIILYCIFYVLPL